MKNALLTRVLKVYSMRLECVEIYTIGKVSSELLQIWPDLSVNKL